MPACRVWAPLSQTAFACLPCFRSFEPNGLCLRPFMAIFPLALWLRPLKVIFPLALCPQPLMAILFQPYGHTSSWKYFIWPCGRTPNGNNQFSLHLTAKIDFILPTRQFVPHGGSRFHLCLTAITDLIPPTQQFAPHRNNQFLLRLTVIIDFISPPRQFTPHGNFDFSLPHNNLPPHGLTSQCAICFASWPPSSSFGIATTIIFFWFFWHCKGHHLHFALQAQSPHTFLLASRPCLSGQ